MIRLLTYTLAALFLATAILNAAERPVLRAQATITGDVVRIGDLVENAGIVANKPIFRAPALGETGSVSVTKVLEALRAHSLIGLDPGSLSEVTVTRASRTIPVQEIETLITAALARDYSLGNAADVSLTFDRVPRALQLEPTVTANARLAQLNYDARSGRFDAAVEVPGAAIANLRLTGTAIATMEVVTLSRAIGRGEVIKMDAVALQRVPRGRAGSDVITDPDQAIGLAARTPLASNRPLLAADLMKPEIIQRGAAVTIYYQVPGVMLAVRGKASEGGAEGDVIDVVNVQSNRALRGTVIGPGQVSVVSMAPRILAAAEVPEAPVRTPPVSGAK
jgi:flagella basal body P-ring formation protein FlgA